MASYTAIPDSDLDPGEPLTSSKIKSLNNNLEGVTEGVSGAPRIKAAALNPDAVANALGRDFDAGSTEVGDVGTIAFLAYNGGTEVIPGKLIVSGGGNLKFAGITTGAGGGTTIDTENSPLPSGTWLSLGYMSGISSTNLEATLFVRVS